MAYTNEQLERIFDRTGGKCHLCGKKLAWMNYGMFKKKMAWEVEHSIARAMGGSDHGNNLYAAHIRCNRSKGTLSTKSARARHERTRAPLSMKRRRQVKGDNALTWGIVGGLVTLIVAPELALLGAAISAVAGYGAEAD